MAAGALSDLRGVRDTLGKNQREMAALLGLSLRAVQSYEQGWRTVPPYVQQTVSLLLFLNWRKDGHKVSPCWQARSCRPAERNACPAYQFRGGELCWLIPDTVCGGTRLTRWDDKIARCRKCLVTAPWMPR